LVEDISDHFRRVNAAEIAWTKTVLTRVRAGGYQTPGRRLTR
jgi:hypothetical protein